MLQRMFVVCASLVLALSSSFAAGAQSLPVPSVATGRIEGRIVDASQQPLAGAEVRASGPAQSASSTDAAGRFHFDALVPGIYTLDVTKAGFTPIEGTATVLSGAVTTQSFTLAPVTLATIQTIGRVAITGNRLNTSSASVAAITNESFLDQGQLNVTRALNELPGVEVGLTTDFYGSGIYNGASPVATGVPIVRGALPYETESLIDGHPINIGLNGSFNPAFINPYVLQDVEIVKGPGSSATTIFNAIGGTMNFRTLEPTRTRQNLVDFGIDQWGGQSGNVRATGTLGSLAYAFDYASQGTPGYAKGFNPLDPLVIFGPGDTINGHVACGNSNATGCVLGVWNPPDPRYIGNPNYENAVDFVSGFFGCCRNVPMNSNSRNELGKLRYNFTPTTSLTVTYLGGQQRSVLSSGFDYSLPDYYFSAPPGYAGSYPNLTPLPIDTADPGFVYTNVNLYGAEFRTTAGPVTFNARWYAASDFNLVQRGFPDRRPVVFTENFYGGLPLDNSVTPTIFNGQPVVISENWFDDATESDSLYGLTFQATAPLGPHTLSLSFDSSHTKSFAEDVNQQGTVTTLYSGSGQYFQTIAAQAQLQLSPRFRMNIANYASLYTDHYTQDFGKTFVDSTHAYDVPRISFQFRPSGDVALRAAAGFSVTAPYLSLLENSAAQAAQYPVVYATETANAGSVRPETAFGWDLGGDAKLSRYTTVSGDVYMTTLHDQFLTTQTLSPDKFTILPGNAGNYTPGSYPLYVLQTANLGHSRYEGIELGLRREPLLGLGYKLQGSLQRAFVYDLPPGFYDTAAGPKTTNLGILPYENFQTSGDGYNGIAFTRVPYSQGYAELNYTFRNGAHAVLGATYYGPNNSYNEPAFAVVNGSFRQPLGRNASVLLTATNITSAYSYFLPNDFGGIPVPLVDGHIGYDPANVVGPSTLALTFRVKF